MSSSSKNVFTQNQNPLSDRQNSILNPAMNLGRHSPGPSSTTRIVAPRPFYRSQITPDPFDYSNNNQHYLQNRSQRRYSANQINGK